MRLFQGCRRKVRKDKRQKSQDEERSDKIPQSGTKVETVSPSYRRTIVPAYRRTVAPLTRRSLGEGGQHPVPSTRYPSVSSVYPRFPPFGQIKNYIIFLLLTLAFRKQKQAEFDNLFLQVLLYLKKSLLL